MPESIEGSIRDFLTETEPLVSRLEELPYETAAELYELYDDVVKSSTFGIGGIDAELRAEICSRQDELLERIIDMQPAHKTITDKPSHVYTPGVQGYRRWSNVELLKDKCLAGYMLARKLEAKPVMYFGSSASDYPNLRKLPGLELLYDNSMPDGDSSVYYDHLLSHYQKMDVLILHGMYEQTLDYLDIYRKLRPDGKVYCGLDMNSRWMARIDWENTRIKNFLKQCDIVATSCSSLRDQLNRNPRISAPCRWLSNGFCNFSDIPVTANAHHKKNVILTVARIGAPMKNNRELLIAFAKISDMLHDWTLRLVGPVAPDFQPVIEQYFSRRPDLKDRVIFTGAIADKEDLYKEYAEAKIFALTSKYEGGPNVYAEALFHGCKFITSDIDAADDITGFDTLGVKYPLGDMDALCSALVSLAGKSGLSDMQEHIPLALAYGRRYFDWKRNAEKLAYMLYHM